ncbi:MAG: S1C family serine protease [Lachnospiraceae bacterium]|jgi:Trypsin-like serine proteases, typically periplasmic, contain C-terminal PDZ domain
MDENRYNDKSETYVSQNKEVFLETTSDFEFLQEKIKERPINKKKLFRRMLITASLAVLFGVLACLSFLLLEPILNNWLYPEEKPGIVTFPQEQDEMRPEDMLTEGTTASHEENKEQKTEIQTNTLEGKDERQSTTVSEMLESSVKEESNREQLSGEDEFVEENTMEGGSEQEESGKGVSMQEGNISGSHSEAQQEAPMTEETIPIEPLKPYQTQYEELYKVYREMESSMVTVTAVHSDVDWFNNTYQSEGTTAGVIIANNNRELLILSRKSSLNGAETIRISFCNGTEADAVIKQYDKNTDLVVLAVDLKFLEGDTLVSVTVATLGSSISSGMTGTPVIAIGNLFGYKDNVCYGMITSKGNPVTMADSEYKLMTTDIYAGTNPSGILVNMQREVIGIINNSHNHDDTKNLLSAVGITELKGLITKLSNGEAINYLGIYVQDISEQTRKETGLPQGAFIVDIDMDSPAMLKGIQKGDILVRVGSQEIRSAADYMNVLRNAPAETSINIVVQRASVNAFEEMHFVVQPEKQE